MPTKRAAKAEAPRRQDEVMSEPPKAQRPTPRRANRD